MKLLPIVGIDNTSNDDALVSGGKNPQYHMRDIVNFNISDHGTATLRKSGRKVSDLQLETIWQSPLHKTIFGVDKVGMLHIVSSDWSSDVIGRVGHSACFCVVNNLVYISGADGLFVYNGKNLLPLTVATPSSPMVLSSEGGSLEQGQYVVAISHSTAQGESSLSKSDAVTVGENSKLSLTLPFVTDENVQKVNIYITSSNGTEMYLHSTYQPQTVEVDILDTLSLGRSANLKHLSPMVSGQHLCYWKSRLLTVQKNIIHFSETLTYHLTDERYNYVRMPQTITFLIPVESGLWVGMIDKVAFLRGSAPDDLSLEIKTAQPPIRGSAIVLDSEVSGELGAGNHCALWLASNGWNIGSSDGTLLEPQAKRLSNITARSGRSVRFGHRVITIVR